MVSWVPKTSYNAMSILKIKKQVCSFKKYSALGDFFKGQWTKYSINAFKSYWQGVISTSVNG